MGRIHKLSEELINQIAAGEVVERPASVVKELVENAVDARATVVRVALEGGGVQLVEVVDDGVGMSPADAVLSLERHATSKLVDQRGLFAIATKGFRGEALPSIASVSRFRLTTSEPGAGEGTRLTVEGGGPVRREVVAPAPGTTVRVEDLFFNVPARRKFLKRQSTELSHCEEAITRVALAHPEVGFFLTHDGREVLSAPPASSLAERVVALLGSEVKAHLLAVDERRLGVTVSGLIASPELTLPTARGLYTLVNRRYVRDRGLNGAIQRALSEQLPPGRQPVAVLFVDVDPAEVDVNVHPQKLEVRFADPRGVQDALVAALKGALEQLPWRQPGPLSGPPDVEAHYAHAVERFLNRAQGFAPFVDAPGGLPAVAEPHGRPAFGTARPTLDDAPPEGYFASLSFIGELARRYWIAEAAGGTLVVIDPRGVAERLALDQLVRGAGGQGDQAGLFSFTVDLGRAAAGLDRAGPGLAALGFQVEPFGPTAAVVRGLPGPLVSAGLSPARIGALLVEVMGLLAEGTGPAAAARVVAAVIAGEVPPPPADRAAALLAALEGVDRSVPGSRRVVVTELPVLELDRLAAR